MRTFGIFRSIVPARVSHVRSRKPFRLLARSALRSPSAAAHRFSTSMSIIRWATWRIISRTKSMSPPFSASSVNAIVLLLVVIVCLCVEVVGLVPPTITGNHNERRPRVQKNKKDQQKKKKNKNKKKKKQKNKKQKPSSAQQSPNLNNKKKHKHHQTRHEPTKQRKTNN